MTLSLDAYLDRINHRAPVRPDLDTLTALHRAHLIHIPYENLDIHRGVPLTLDLPTLYRKIVVDRRGGWCFEMNGLLAWALREIGFDVTLLASSVGRGSADEPFIGDHLILLVQLDRPYLADVGFGNGLFEPIPLAEGRYRQGGLEFGLRLAGDRWWFENQPDGGAGYDFTLEPHALADFAAESYRLQTSPASGFVRATVCFRFTPEGLLTLRGAVFRRLTAAGEQEQIIEDAESYARILDEAFDLRFSSGDAAALWEKVWTRHLAWRKAQGT
ncbi:MAG: arylamine N-acetyltransferase [Anaerolineae bacterium]|nr:arylamine N-acetyltransferase [Anaerolineae bacterium]